MFWPNDASVSCSNLFATATYEPAESASSPTHLLGGGEKPREPKRGSPETPGLTMPEDPGAGAASPRVGLPGTSMSAPCFTKSRNKPLASSLSWGLAPSTSTLAVPFDTPSALGIIGASSSRASDVRSTNVGDSTGATGGHRRPEVTTDRLPRLATNNATKDRCGNVTGHTACQRTTSTEEVLLLSLQHHRLKLEQIQEKLERRKPTNNAIPGGHW
jgi:hypothetical protein